MIPDPNDSWAQVELYRWQYGKLPDQNGKSKSLNESKALAAMADAIEQGCKSKDSSIMPSPFNVCAVMRYISKKLK